MAQTVKARISIRIACWRWTRARANTFGISRLVHHDLWDYDAVAAPKLLTIKHDGKNVDVVAQATKQGFLFVFDRVTGKPIWPIEERKVPQTDVPGEEAWPTQPFPTVLAPFARQKFTADDVNPYMLDPKEREKFKEAVANSRNLGLYTPPAMVNTMEIPGNKGGANWAAPRLTQSAAGFMWRRKNCLAC